MQKIFLLFVTIIGVSCDNGNFEIPSFTFTETINSCGTYVLHRTNIDKTEALILVLDTNVIKNSPTTAPRTLHITAENTQYRIFDGPIGANFFCQNIPPQFPITKKTWNGVAGNNSYISVNSNARLNSSNEIIGYKHVIYLNNMTLINGSDKFTYESYFFGEFFTEI